MKTKDIITKLKEVDPSGETHVRLGSGELVGFIRKEGYYDGAYIYINEDDKLPDIVLKNVKHIQSVLGNLPYETIRKVLYRKYGLVVKDDNDIKDLYMITYNKKEKYKNNINLPEDCQKFQDPWQKYQRDEISQKKMIKEWKKSVGKGFIYLFINSKKRQLN